MASFRGLLNLPAMQWVVYLKEQAKELKNQKEELEQQNIELEL